MEFSQRKIILPLFKKLTVTTPFEGWHNSAKQLCIISIKELPGRCVLME
jgi:hypothetical protein